MAGSFLNTQYREVRPARAEQLPDGRKRLTRFVSFKQNSEFPAEMGGTVATSTDAASNWSSPPTGWENLYLISAATDTSLSPNGSGNNPVTILTYESAGTIAQTDETKNGGALLIRTIRTAHTAPATPSGYTLIRQDDDNPSGFDTFTYTFAKGDGEISRSTEYRQSDDTGTTGVTVITIRHLTPSATGTDPTSSPGAGYVKTSEDKADQDGHRVWTVVYAKGTGLVAQSIRARQDGIREVTNVSLGTKSTPSGIVIEDDYRIVEGFKVYTVTAMQSASGGNVTDATVSFERYVPFTYPGRAKTFSETVNGRKFLDVFRSPPVTTDVKATVTVSYTTTSTLGTISDYWNPSEWATLRAAWVGLGDNAFNQVTALPGYRSVDEDPIEETCSITAPNDLSCLGNTVFGGEKAKVWCTGGPADPGTNTYTLDATLEPAFTSYDGTVYYRKTLVTATIPAQDALPV